MADNEVKLPSEPMTGELLPCPFCGKANQDRWPCEWLDGSGANVVRCAWCHGAAPMDVWNRRATNPAADALETVRELPAKTLLVSACLAGRHSFTADAIEDGGEPAIPFEVAVSALDAVLAQQPEAEARAQGGREFRDDLIPDLEARAACADEVAGDLMREAARTLRKLSRTAPEAPAQEAVAYGMRRKGTTAIVGLVPPKIANKPASSAEYMAQFEEIPLYTAPQPAIPEGFVAARVELTLPIANALGYDSAFQTWEEMQQTWHEALLAARPTQEPDHD